MHTYYMETKTCSTCKKDLDPTSFSKNQAKKDGRNSICKSCHSEYIKKHYINNKASYIQRATNRTEVARKVMTERVKEYKSLQGCLLCDETDGVALDFHHIESDNKESTISRMVKDGRSWESILKEASKCVILCANCHRKVHAHHIHLLK